MLAGVVVEESRIVIQQCQLSASASKDRIYTRKQDSLGHCKRMAAHCNKAPPPVRKLERRSPAWYSEIGDFYDRRFAYLVSWPQVAAIRIYHSPSDGVTCTMPRKRSSSSNSVRLF